MGIGHSTIVVLASVRTLALVRRSSNGIVFDISPWSLGDSDK